MQLVIVFFKAIFMFLAGIVAFRLMGSQAVGRLTDFDLVVVIAIGALMGAPLIDPEISPIVAIVAIGGFVFAQFIFSFLSLKSHLFEDIIKGKSIMLVKDGKLQKKGFLKARMTVRNFEQELRIHGMDSVEAIEQANLEPNGKLSFILKRKKAGD